MSAGEVHAAARRVLDLCQRSGLKVATAESCTGGLVIAALTDLPGSSAVVERGFVTYSNAAKETVLSVSPATLADSGAVSAQTAKAMAQGALAHSPADLAIAVTGIAGPGGGTPDKPVGLVFFAAATRCGGLLERERRFGNLARCEIRRQSVLEALSMLAVLASRAAPPTERRAGQ